MSVREGVTGQLQVLGDARQERAWSSLVADVAALTGRVPAVQPRPSDGEGGGQRALLLFAAATTDPVLLLPPGEAPLRPVPPVRARRILLAMDRTAAERRVLEPWVRRAREFGAELEQLHVLVEVSRPAMWEGPGHHAEEWREEVRRRHRLGDGELSVRSGDPAAAISSAAARADLVILCWSGETAFGRARVLRRVLRSVDRPVLLVHARTAGPAVASQPGARPTSDPE